MSIRFFHWSCLVTTDCAGIRYLSSASIAASTTSPGRSGNSSRATFLAKAGSV